MNERRFYELIDVTGPLPSETDAQISRALDLLPSSHPARGALLKAASANSKVGLRIQDLRDWGAESFGDPARGIPDPRQTQTPSTPPPSSDKPADSMWSMYKGPTHVSTLSDDDMRFVIASGSGDKAEYNRWFGIIGGTAKEVQDAWQRAAAGNNKFDQAAYISKDGPIVRAYRNAGGRV